MPLNNTFINVLIIEKKSSLLFPYAVTLEYLKQPRFF